MTARRTQAERKAATIAALVTATIEVLAERGYSGASTKAICQAAGCTQGALFRHFPTRAALLTHVASELGQRTVGPFKALGDLPSPDTRVRVPALVSLMQQASRSETHAAWREIVVAARTDADLLEAVSCAVAELEAQVIATVTHLFGVHGPAREYLCTTVLSLMHMFDSEAVTRLAKQSPAIEQQRLEWAIQTLEHALSRAGARQPAPRPQTINAATGA